MKIVINTNTATIVELTSLSKMLKELATNRRPAKKDQLPSNLTISTGPIEFDPAKVTVHTSVDGAAYAQTEAGAIETADTVEKVELNVVESTTIQGTLGCEGVSVGVKDGVRTFKNTVDKAAEKREGPGPKPNKKGGPTPDARSLVEAVVGVTTGTVEAEGTVEEVVAALDKGEDVIDAATTKAIKALSLKCAKYGKMPEAKDQIRSIVNVGGPVKLSEIPAKNSDAVIAALEAIVKGAEDNG